MREEDKKWFLDEYVTLCRKYNLCLEAECEECGTAGEFYLELNPHENYYKEIKELT